MPYEVLQFFGFDHLPEPLKEVSLPVGMLARSMASELPFCEETREGLRKLLEAKDCFVRARIIQMSQEKPDANG